MRILRNQLGIVVVAAAAAIMAGCSGKGIDARLSTANEASYRDSLNRAWKEMTVEQQNAFNWAVSDMSLPGLMANYQNPTPREVISKETDGYIKKKTLDLANLTAEYAKVSEKLEEQERAVQDARNELGKIKVTSASLRKTEFFNDPQIVFVTQNNSRYGVSQAEWDAWLFLDGEEKSNRYCKVSAYYSVDGGLDSKKSKQYSTHNLSFDCRGWDTIEVQRAKTKNVVMDLDLESVKDFGERKILPSFEVTKATYEDAIKKAKDEIQVAANMKAVLNKN